MAVRRESVLLELEDRFTQGVLRAAAATKVLDKELNSLSGRSAQTSRDTDRVSSSLNRAGVEAEQAGKKVRRASDDLNQFTGRWTVALRAIGSLGPAIIPIGGALVPAISALTVGLGAAASAAGVALVAFNGLGDAMGALDEYQLAPTKDNFQKLREEMDKIGPTGAEMVRFLDSIEPQLKSVQEAARQGLFPGVQQGIETLLAQLPQVRRMVFDIADALGDVAANTARGLTGDGFRAFFDYIKTDAAPMMKAFAAATGNVAEGIANLLVGFAPLTRDFTGGMVAATEAFANWSAELSATDGFREFLDYLRETGPQVAQLIGQISLALAAIVEAAAPVGQALLPVLTSLAKVIETIAKSDIGTPLFTAVAAMSALRLATQLWGKVAATTGAQFVATNAKSAASIMAVTTATQRATMKANELAAFERQRTTTAVVSAGKMAAVLGGLALAGTGATDSIGLTNTASLALMGTMFGPWGTAIGGAAGLTMDLAAANNNLESAIRGADDAIRAMDVSALQTQLAALDEQMAAFDERTEAEFSWNPLKFSKENLDAVIAGTNEMISGTRESAEAKREEASAALETAKANARYAAHARIAGRNAGYSASEIRGMTEAMAEQRNEAIQAFDAVTRYAQALADARKHARDAKGGIDASTKAGRENRDVLSNLAGAWNNQSEAVTNNIAKWREARANFIQTATAMGVPIAKARDLADRLMEIPRQRVIDVEMRGGQDALDAIARIKRELASVPRELRTTYYVNQINSISRRYDPQVGIPGRASGGTVPKDNLPYADRYLYMLAGGEEVISNRRGQADRFRPLLKAINNAADGATVGFGASPLLGFGAGIPLHGIDQAAVSIKELGDRIASLSANEIRELSRRFDSMGKFELKRLGKALDLATQAAEKQAEQAREFAAEQQEQLKALRDARRQFAQQVSGNFSSDVFGGINLEQAAKDGLLGGSFITDLMTWLRENNIDTSAGGMISDYAGQYLATLSPEQIASLEAQATVGQLGLDGSNADRFEEVLRRLRRMGLRGGAYNELAASGNLELAEAYLAQGRPFVQSLTQGYRERRGELRELGEAVGNARFGADIREQLKETRRANRLAEEANADRKALLRGQRQLERRMQEVEKAAGVKGPDRFAQKVNNAVTHGGRSAT